MHKITLFYNLYIKKCNKEMFLLVCSEISVDIIAIEFKALF